MIEETPGGNTGFIMHNVLRAMSLDCELLNFGFDLFSFLPDLVMNARQALYNIW